MPRRSGNLVRGEISGSLTGLAEFGRVEAMKQQDLKKLIRGSAEKPLRIRLADGASYKVPHPEFAIVTSESLILASGPGLEVESEFIVVPLNHVIRAEVLKRKTKAV